MITNNGIITYVNQHEPNNPIYKFAQKLTDCFEDACKFYPEFKRVQEIFNAFVLAKYIMNNKISFSNNWCSEAYQKNLVANYNQTNLQSTLEKGKIFIKKSLLLNGSRVSNLLFDTTRIQEIYQIDKIPRIDCQKYFIKSKKTSLQLNGVRNTWQLQLRPFVLVGGVVLSLKSDIPTVSNPQIKSKINIKTEAKVLTNCKFSSNVEQKDHFLPIKNDLSQKNIILNENFIKSHREIENDKKIGKKGDLWFPHPSLEGGNDTIGYEHKLTNEEIEKYKNGITEEQAIDLHRKDLAAAFQGAKEVYEQQNPGKKFEDCHQGGQQVAIDLCFNVGKGNLKKYVKFMKALEGKTKEEIQTMLNECGSTYKDKNNGKIHNMMRRMGFRQNLIIHNNSQGN